MEYDIWTNTLALQSICNLLSITVNEFSHIFIYECGVDSEAFWKYYFEKLDKVKLDDIKIHVRHVTGTLDECSEIKQAGLRNLQWVLSNNTILASILKKFGIIFDVENRDVYYKGNRLPISKNLREPLWHRIYCDYCIDGFLYCDDVKEYGYDVYKRPEFFMNLLECFPNIEKLDEYWKSKSKTFLIEFYATVNQINKCTFDTYFDEKILNPIDETEEIDVNQKIKRWLLIKAIDRLYNKLDETYAYIEDDGYIPANQILRYTEIESIK